MPVEQLKPPFVIGAVGFGIWKSTVEGDQFSDMDGQVRRWDFKIYRPQERFRDITVLDEHRISVRDLVNGGDPVELVREQINGEGFDALRWRP